MTKAVRGSTLPAPSRLVMLVLADVALVGTAEIPEQFTPSLNVLARETGLDKSTVTRHLASLEQAGWLVRDKPSLEDARRLGKRTKYRLDVPAGVVAENTYGVGAEDNHPSCTDPQDLGAENDKARCTEQQNKKEDRSLSDQSDHSSSAKPPKAPKTKRKRADPDPESVAKANAIVAAYIDGATAAGQDKPTTALIGRVGRDAKRLIAEGIPTEKLLAAADLMGRGGWQSLDVQLQRMSAGRNRPTNGYRSYRDPEDPETAYSTGL